MAEPAANAKDDRGPDRAKANEGDTVTVQGEQQLPQPRMPHERDESADSQAPATAGNQRIGEIAHDSVQRGETDTDKGPVLDAAYEGLREGQPKQRPR